MSKHNIVRFVLFEMRGDGERLPSHNPCREISFETGGGVPVRNVRREGGSLSGPQFVPERSRESIAGESNSTRSRPATMRQSPDQTSSVLVKGFLEL